MLTHAKIAVLGGGTGSFVVASGLRAQPLSISMLLTMVDDGGSNKVIRDEFGLLPTSGVRQAIVALSENHTMLRKLFTYRYSKGGEGLKGMTFGNLFMAAMADIMQSQSAAIAETCKLLKVKGQILPISYDDVQLVATLADGSQVIGEHRIDEPQHDGTQRIVGLTTMPPANITPLAARALQQADVIVLGPGDFYTNTIANLVVLGVVPAIMASRAKLVFISNLMTKYGETYNYTLRDYLSDLSNYLPLERLDYVVINSNQDFPPDVLTAYQQEQSIPIVDDLDANFLAPHTHIIREDLLSRTVVPPEPGDNLRRSIIRHDAQSLGAVMARIAGTGDSTNIDHINAFEEYHTG